MTTSVDVLVVQQLDSGQRTVEIPIRIDDRFRQQISDHIADFGDQLVCVVAVVGRGRNGKSLIMNSIIAEFTENAYREVFAVSDNYLPETKGIGMFIFRYNGACVMLLDVEGRNPNDLHNHSALCGALAFHLSSTIIIVDSNGPGVIKTDLNPALLPPGKTDYTHLAFLLNMSNFRYPFPEARTQNLFRPFANDVRGFQADEAKLYACEVPHFGAGRERQDLSNALREYLANMNFWNWLRPTLSVPSRVGLSPIKLSTVVEYIESFSAHAAATPNIHQIGQPYEKFVLQMASKQILESFERNLNSIDTSRLSLNESDIVAKDQRKAALAQFNQIAGNLRAWADIEEISATGQRISDDMGTKILNLCARLTAQRRQVAQTILSDLLGTSQTKLNRLITTFPHGRLPTTIFDATVTSLDNSLKDGLNLMIRDLFLQDRQHQGVQPQPVFPASTVVDLANTVRGDLTLMLQNRLTQIRQEADRYRMSRSSNLPLHSPGGLLQIQSTISSAILGGEISGYNRVNTLPDLIRQRIRNTNTYHPIFHPETVQYHPLDRLTGELQSRFNAEFSSMSAIFQPHHFEATFESGVSHVSLTLKINYKPSASLESVVYRETIQRKADVKNSWDVNHSKQYTKQISDSVNCSIMLKMQAGNGSPSLQSDVGSNHQTVQASSLSSTLQQHFGLVSQSQYSAIFDVRFTCRLDVKVTDNSYFIGNFPTVVQNVTYNNIPVNVKISVPC